MNRGRRGVRCDAAGPGLLCGFRRRLFIVEIADLGKRRRCTAFRADSACETAQKLQTGLACVEGSVSKHVFRFCRRWSRGHCDCCGHRQGFFANLPMSRRGHRRYRPTSRPPSLRAAIRLGNACGPASFRLCISAWRSSASARISRRGTCRRRGFGGEPPCSAARRAPPNVLGDAPHELL